MPTYSYFCEKCNENFELFFYIKNYESNPKCEYCRSAKKTHRLYSKDVLSQSASVKKSDSELKTIGDLANRNRDRMTDDQKQNLYDKHNKYKEETPKKALPKGMTRISKPKVKNKWT
jgi:putative FmdB family regulatory protein